MGERPQPNETPTMTVENVLDFLATSDPGSYVLLDVRQPAEYEEVHLPGARLTPLPELLEAVPDLDRTKPTVVYCASGGRSRVAVQLLQGQGFEKVFSMTGGIYQWEGSEAVGPQELNMDLVRDDQSPAEMIALAYRMEDGLQRFYQASRASAQDVRVTDLLQTLIEVEERHKERLEGMYAALDAQPTDLRGLTGDSDKVVMEGGFVMDEFMAQNLSFMGDREKILEMAIMLESQALDLYLRFASRIQVTATRELLYAIAREEQSHLTALGRLYDRIN
jgi:sulfur-carrier protein adenylyltransferase/sulfurtransferase